MSPSSNAAADPLPVVLITGCSAGGIGFELARALAASGAARVIATARDVSKMKGLQTEAAAETGGILALLPLDVTDEASVSEAAKQVLQLTHDRGCDVLVNNAGMTFKGTVLDSDVSETARLFGTNVFGLLRATQAFTEKMVSRGRGLVVNVGSATGYIHQATKSSYSASKHAVRCLTDTMRVELAPFNVRVFLVSPGYVATPIDDKAGEQGRWFAPKAGVSPYAAANAIAETGAAASSSSSSLPDEEGFKKICMVRESSFLKVFFLLFFREKKKKPNHSPLPSLPLSLSFPTNVFRRRRPASSSTVPGPPPAPCPRASSRRSSPRSCSGSGNGLSRPEEESRGRPQPGSTSLR